MNDIVPPRMARRAREKAVLIAICEDSPHDMEAMLDLCDRFASARGYVMDTLPFASAEALLLDAGAKDADVLILDIMMPGPEGEGPAGVVLARQVRRDGFAGAIIFTTTSPDYYPEGFEVGAAHYLIKPVTDDAFAGAMARAIRQVERPERMISVPVNRIQVSVAESSIAYAEVYGRETVLHTTGEQVRVLLPLKKIEQLLSGDPFLRCYRSYIINMAYVQSLEEDHFVLRGGVRIPISLRSRQALKKRYFDYRLAQPTDGDLPRT